MLFCSAVMVIFFHHETTESMKHEIYLVFFFVVLSFRAFVINLSLLVPTCLG